MNKINFSVDGYEEICGEYREICLEEKELKARKEKIREQLLELSGGERMEYGVKIMVKTKQGSVDYERMVEELGIDVLTVERYRKPSVEYTEVRTY